ncbi:DNA-binding domain-containing protein, AraC-type [Caulobacter sp. AP07]|uniref:helix-turn-helix domain-containing protein n=1 Tax=Caulobacter sp. AP07 TaxID=1144304 RepID=UPI000271EE3F|nr:helix-turn-helix domain-containing protein [Caulobacter sp. AP07]EJL26048.1 DNA-binding domain-containing protein, AraC-type [Caulobacter sp. AP07]
MKAWSFSTDSHPRAERAEAWREAMSRLGLPIEGLSDAEPASASVVCLTSPLGIEFALVEAGAQAISGRRTGQPAAVWLAVLLSGQATLVTDDLAEEMVAGDIAYGPTGQPAALRLETRCRLMFVRAPRVALDHRLIAPVSLRIGRLQGATGVAHILSGLLRATADGLEDLTVDQLRPVELALTEFLAICLVEGGAETDVLGVGGGSGAPTAHLQRLCQTIETLLPDPDLSLRRVADEEGVSPRYVQKLFASADETFSHYLRTRRLERCRTDLASPQHARLSISEICFRWGFNGSAHFSRAFRDQYGMSPREFRQGAAA